MKYNVNLKSNNKKKGRKKSYKKNFNLGVSSLFSKRKSNRGTRKKRTPVNIMRIFGKKTKYGKGKKRKSKVNKFKKFISRIFSALAAFSFFCGVVGLVIIGIFLKEVNETLPEPGQLLERKQDESTIIYDRNGEKLYQIYGDKNRVHKGLEEYPPHVVIAVLAAEDAEFYEHKGLDWIGIARCGYLSAKKYLTGKGMLCGASTVSQQLVRNTLMFEAFGKDAYDRSTFINAVKRKLREMLMTMQVEKTMSKDELLEMYMNEVNLGGVNYGFEAGAQSLYGKPVEELTIEEAAVLAGLIQSPSRYNPVNGSQPEMAEQRKNYVLTQILKHHDTFENGALANHIDLEEFEITEEKINEAKEVEIEYTPGRMDIKAPHFVWYVKDEVVHMDDFNLEMVERGGLRIYTTLDWETQKIAQKSLTNGIKNRGSKYGIKNGAMVVMTPDNGEIVAMVGSVDYWNIDDPKIDGNVNVSTSIRQMGSAFKPITYLTSFHQGYIPGTAAPDLDEFDFGYDARNWDRKFYGMMTAREALVRSRNIPALNTIQTVGIDSTIQASEKLGITTLTHRNRYGLSLTLGSGGEKLLEHTAAFSVFANEGVKAGPESILKITDSQGNTLYEKDESSGERVFDEKEVYLLNWTLCDVGGFGDQLVSHNYMDGGRRMACGKGGTTNGPRDLSGFLYHKNLVVGTWAGNNDNSIIRNASSSTVTVPIAGDFMRNGTIKKKYPSKLFSKPSGISQGVVCKDTGLLAGKDTDCPKESTIYIRGRAPATDNREVIKVCKDNGKIPSNLEVAEKFDLVKSRVFLNYKYHNSNQHEHYVQHFSKKPYNYLFELPETGDCDIDLGDGGQPLIELISPSDGTILDAGTTVELVSTAYATKGVDYVHYKLDGVVISGSRVGNEPYSYVWSIPKDIDEGAHTLTVEVYDKSGTMAMSSISIVVNNAYKQVELQLTSPINRAQFELSELPVELSADVTGSDADEVNRVVFSINKVGGGYSKLLTDSDGSDGWSVNWLDSNVTPGNYQIKVLAVEQGLESGTVTVEVL